MKSLEPQTALPTPEIVVDAVTVEFPGVRALDNVSLTFRPGEVHGVIGENGAGKSTLMKVLAGLQKPTHGQLRLNGEPVSLTSAADAGERGIAMIHQELNLVDELDVAENLLLGREPRRGPLINRQVMHEEARRWLAAVGSDLDTRHRVGRLSVAQQQIVEIAKAVSQRAGVLIMDEPTAVLGERESERLFDLIRRLRSEGRTVIYISHRLPEVRGLCDRVSVLRDGQFVTTLDRAALDPATEADLASLMVGRSVEDLGGQFPDPKSPHDEIVFESRGPVSLKVRSGEIFGLAGLIGAGRTEWAEAVVGLRPGAGAGAGEILVDGQPVRIRRVADALRAGVAYVSEDRKSAGLELEMSIAANTTLATLPNYTNPPAAGPIGLIDFKAERSVALAHAHNLRTKFARLRDAVSTLSGGNQQKVALAKWLDARPRVLILDEPTRGVDVGAKREIYRVIANLAEAGMACIVISSELPELLGLCHRIGVVRQNRLVATFDGAEATEERLMHAAAGVEG